MSTRLPKAIARAVETLLFWLGILLALPNCGFTGDAGSPPPDPNLPPGPEPHSSAIFCDIEKQPGRHCATDLDLARGIRLSEAAIALVEGRDSDVALDDSPDALARCGGRPEAVKFEGPFPQGLPVCLNCGTLMARFANNDAACMAACYDLFGTLSESGDFTPTNPPNPFTIAYCNANARRSTNVPFTECLLGLCSDDGVLNDDVRFFDPRRRPQMVNWTDLKCTGTSIGYLSRYVDPSRGCLDTGNYDAGAASLEVITKGDAYLQFYVSRTDQAVLVGLHEIQASCAPPSWCPDEDPTPADVPFYFEMASGSVYVVARGETFPVGPFAAGEQFRITLRDRGDGTATVIFSRITGPCLTAMPCPQDELHRATSPAAYPMRIDASFVGVGTFIRDAHVVRIQ